MSVSTSIFITFLIVMSTEGLERSRSAVRGHVTRALNGLKTEFEKDTRDIAKISLLLDTANDLLEKVRALDNDIVDSFEDDSLVEAHVEEAFNYLLDADGKLKAFKTRLDIFDTGTDEHDAGTGTIPFNTLPGPLFKVGLPKQNLPKFGGDRLAWPTFYESFIESVDKVKAPDVQKLTCLRSLLYDKAERCIAGLPTTNGSYKTALELLRSLILIWKQ